MDQIMRAKYPRTNLFILDEEVWSWAKYRAETLGFDSVAEYLFKLIKLDREKNLVEAT